MDRLVEQGRLDFTVAPRRQTVWGAREGVVFALEGLAASGFVAFMLIGHIAAMAVGVLLMAIAVVLLLSHLGNPWRAWLSVRNVRRSWISRGTVAIGGFIGLGAGYLALLVWFGLDADGSAARIIQAVLILAALFILFYPGFAMAASPAIPFWNSGLLPVLCMVGGLVSGASVLAAFLALSGGGIRPYVNFAAVMWGQVAALCFLTAIVFAYLSVMRRSGAAARRSAVYLTRDRAWLFWGGAVGLGLVLPLAATIAGASTDATLFPLLAVAARIPGDVALRVGLLKAGIYDAVI